MKALRIVSDSKMIKQFYCKNCSKASNSLCKIDQNSFCDECVPDQFKDKLVTVNQNREIIR